jgi:molybdopterin converting factor small subunit
MQRSSQGLNRDALQLHLLRSPMKILIPTPLRPYAAKQSAVDLPASTVGEALAGLITRHPDLRKHLYTDGGKLRAFVNLYLNEDDVRYLQQDQTPVNESDTLIIVPSIAGGGGPFTR